MIEEYVEGRELYVSVLGNRKRPVLPARELFFGDLPESEPRFATFRAKWDDAYRTSGASETARRPLAPAVEKKLPEFARRIYSLLKIKAPDVWISGLRLPGNWCSLKPIPTRPSHEERISHARPRRQESIMRLSSSEYSITRARVNIT